MSDSTNKRTQSHRPVKAITFDFWATLYDNGPDLRPRYVELLAQAIPGPSEASLSPAFDYAQRMASSVGKMGFRLPVRARIALVLDKLGTSVPPDVRVSLINSWEQVLLDMPPNLIEGAREVLAELRTAGYPLALISDTGIAPGRVIRQLMERDRVGEFFQLFTFSDELGVNKRRKQPFLATCAALGVVPGEGLHVGDLPETDMRNAKASGMRTALATYVSRRYDGAKAADIVLERLTDLPTALATLLR